MPPAPPQPKKVLDLVDLPAVRVKKKGALIRSAHVITGQARGNSGATIVKNQVGPAAAHQGGGTGGAAAVGAIEAKPPVVALIPAVLSAPQREAVPTATVAAATLTATVTTAQKPADEDTLNVHQTLNMSGGAAGDEDDPGDISTPLLPQKILAHVRAATAAGKGTGGIIGAAQEAPAVGVAAPVQDPGDEATVVATVLRVGHPVQTKVPLTDEVLGAEGTVTHIAETSTALASTAPSLHVHLHREALTATPIHPALCP